MVLLTRSEDLLSLRGGNDLSLSEVANGSSQIENKNCQ